MNTVPPDASDEEILGIVRHWVDMLAAEDYSRVFRALGYSLLYQWDRPGPECIEHLIRRYRSPEFFPGIESFKVTNWRTAKGGNPHPKAEVIRYKPNSTRLRGAVAFDLPLNGKWSDLQADFVYFDSEVPYPLALEEIGCYAQDMRELEEWEASQNTIDGDKPGRK